MVVRSAAVEAEDEQGEKEEPDVAGDSEVAVEVQVKLALNLFVSFEVNRGEVDIDIRK